METILLIITIVLLFVCIGLLIAFKPVKTDDQHDKLLSEIEKTTSRIESAVKEEVKSNRQELNTTLTTFQQSFL
ncbi:MAG: hypothetical protein PHY99_06800, partial [Bacteroidales bacterium]|nr:hypothetical protein [Bacteroidales bacterium]